MLTLRPSKHAKGLAAIRDAAVKAKRDVMRTRPSSANSKPHTDLLACVFSTMHLTAEPPTRPEEMTLELQLDPIDMARAEDEKADANRPTSATWFPGTTISGLQPSFVVGCNSGATTTLSLSLTHSDTDTMTLLMLLCASFRPPCQVEPLCGCSSKLPHLWLCQGRQLYGGGTSQRGAHTAI